MGSNAALGGARLTAVGVAQPNTVTFTCEGIPNGALCVYLRATVNSATGFVHGDGVRCAAGSVSFFGQQRAGDGANPPNTTTSSTSTITPGSTRWYQCRYRNSVPGYCTPDMFNMSNAYQITW